MVWIIHCQQIVSETWDHKQLLEEGYHVADAAKVLQPGVASRGLLVIEVRNLPVVQFVGPPGGLVAEFSNVAQNHL